MPGLAVQRLSLTVQQISRNYGTDAVLCLFDTCYHVSAQSHRVDEAAPQERMVSFQGPYHFTTQLRRQAEQEPRPRAGPGAGTRPQQTTDKLALERREGEWGAD